MQGMIFKSIWQGMIFKSICFRCHEKPYAEKSKQASFSEATRFYAEKVEKAVDFFHFPDALKLLK